MDSAYRDRVASEVLLAIVEASRASPESEAAGVPVVRSDEVIDALLMAMVWMCCRSARVANPRGIDCLVAEVARRFRAELAADKKTADAQASTAPTVHGMRHTLSSDPSKWH